MVDDGGWSSRCGTVTTSLLWESPLRLAYPHLQPPPCLFSDHEAPRPPHAHLNPFLISMFDAVLMGRVRRGGGGGGGSLTRWRTVYCVERVSPLPTILSLPLPATACQVGSSLTLPALPEHPLVHLSDQGH
jgi:hypothetical protein